MAFGVLEAVPVPDTLADPVVETPDKDDTVPVPGSVYAPVELVEVELPVEDTPVDDVPVVVDGNRGELVSGGSDVDSTHCSETLSRTYGVRQDVQFPARQVNWFTDVMEYGIPQLV